MTDQTQDQTQEQMQERLDDVEEHIDDARRQAEDHGTIPADPEPDAITDLGAESPADEAEAPPPG
jgi:hypothetical protein